MKILIKKIKIKYIVYILCSIVVCIGGLYIQIKINQPLNIPGTLTDYGQELIESYTHESFNRKVSNVILHHTVIMPETLKQFSISDGRHIGESENRMRIKINGKIEDIRNNIPYHFLIYTYNNKVHILQILPTGAIGYHSGVYQRNIDSIGIAIVGDLTKRGLSPKELKAIKKILKKFPSANVLSHHHVRATACGRAFDKYASHFNNYGKRRVIASKIVNGKEIIINKNIKPKIEKEKEKKEMVKEMNITRYYTPTLDQEYYLHNLQGKWVGKFYPNNRQERKQAYEQDFKINCYGDCLSTASGTRLTNKQADWVVACPKKYKFNTIFEWQGKKRKCWDRGGTIKTNRLDVWMGVGDIGLKNMREIKNGGKQNVTIIK